MISARRYERRRLQERKVAIWDEWADAAGDLCPVYGKQWRDRVAADGCHINQIAELIGKTNLALRRQIVSAWVPRDLHAMALEPCHCLFQTHVANDGRGIRDTWRRARVAIGAHRDRYRHRKADAQRFAAIASFERDLLSERTKAGLDAARARGRKGRRLKSLDPNDVRLARTMLADKPLSITKVAKHFKVGWNTLY